MKKVLATILLCSSLSFAGALKFSYQHGVKPAAHVAKSAAKSSAKGAKKAAHVAKKVVL